MSEILHILVSLLPVFVFLGLLILLDSYKLVTRTLVLGAIVTGCLSALSSLYLNGQLIELTQVELGSFKRYIAPLVEELCKGALVVYLIRAKKVGFMVDAAIYGFALGAGFALVENVYYLQTVESASIFLWIVRGFGTALMHGGSTAIFAIISMMYAERKSRAGLSVFLPGIIGAYLLHTLYNHFVLPPLLMTAAILVIQPLLLFIVFHYSERSLERWLGVGLDSEMELFDLITKGNIVDSRIGRYLESLKERFPGAIVADILCFLRLRLELAMTAKGILLMRQGGHDVPVDDETRAKFEELAYLEKQIGPTGKLAIAPFLQSARRDLWQLQMLSAGK